MSFFMLRKISLEPLLIRKFGKLNETAMRNMSAAILPFPQFSSSPRENRRVASVRHSDLLVLGCGIAGTSAALKAANQGLKVTMLSSSSNVEDCNSFWAQGGIIYKSKDDRPKLLADDVHVAGAGICDNSAVMKLAMEGPRRVEEVLLRMAPVPFNRGHDGSLSLCLEAGHSRARIIHWHDETGKAITQSVQKAALLHPNITVVNNAVATDLSLARSSHNSSIRCAGAHVLLNGQPETFLAPATVLATGGLGEIYAHTSNPKSARGDGFSMALRAGARMSNMEYVQFHPTTLSLPNERSFLLTEAMRGEGALLRNCHQDAFAKAYHQRGELAPRDIVSRMIASEMLKTGADHVYLDITHKDRDWTAKRFPGIYAHCMSRGIDMTRDLLPVVPAAHYFCGGVKTDLEGRTSIPGLFAAGEVACTGLHGGNRLASTSLLEGLVWGCSIAEALTSKGEIDSLARVLGGSTLLSPSDTGFTSPDQALVDAAWRKLQTVMWEYVGVVRTTDGLLTAVTELKDLSKFSYELYSESIPSVEVAGLKNAVDTGLAIAEAAYNNPCSIGAHYLSDEIVSDEGLGLAMQA